ncbi:MAG: hypothetical protein ACI8WB_001245 [Phenylobacterium sp.]|jgi:hypothetical protein
MPVSDGINTDAVHGQTHSQPITDGSWQYQRWPQAFGDNYFNVDEMSFADLLVMGQKIAAQLNFFDLDNTVTGNWGKLFSHDEATLMAMILHLDIEQIKSAFDGIKQQSPQRQWAFVIGRYAQIDHAYRALADSEYPSGQALCGAIKTIIVQKLAVKLHDIRAIGNDCSGDSGDPDVARAQRQLAEFSPLWKNNQSTCQVTHEPSESATVLLTALYSLLHCIEQLQCQTAEYLQQSLHNQYHGPAIGLFMAFLRLFGKLQRELNQFSHRYLDFYFADVLHGEKRRAQPTKAQLAFTLTPGDKSSILVGQGTVFSCGKDAQGKEIVYRADNELRVNNVRVAAIRTLYMLRDNRILPEKTINAVTRIKCDSLDMKTMGKGPGIPLFGADKITSAHSGGSNADIGFALSSPLLRLSEGKRSLELSFCLQEQEQVYGVMSTLVARASKQKKQADVAYSEIFSAYLCQTDSAEVDSVQSGSVQARSGSSGDSSDSSESGEAIYAALLNAKLLADLPQMQAGTIISAENALPCGRIFQLLLIGRLLSASNNDLKLQLFRQLFGRYLLSDNDQWLSTKERQLVITQAQNMPDDGSFAEALMAAGKGAGSDGVGKSPDKQIKGLAALFEMPRRQLFERFLGRMFSIMISTDKGWREIKVYNATRLNGHQQATAASGDGASGGSSTGSNADGQYGFKLSLSLSPSFAPVVPVSAKLHGKQWAATQDESNSELAQPILRVGVGASSRMYPYSLFQDLAMVKVGLNVAVQGLAEVLAYNQEGKLDTSNPFMPFGVRPGRDAYFIVGGAEMAQKPLTGVTLNLNWFDLPGQSGFADYYQQYPQPYSNNSFKVDLKLLDQGRWQHYSCADSLFGSQSKGSGIVLAPSSSLQLSMSKVISAAISSAQVADFGYKTSSRSGFIQVVLSPQSASFGHNEYPTLLSTAMMKNTEVLMIQAQSAVNSTNSTTTATTTSSPQLSSLPNSPYTPVLAGLTLDYQASTEISLDNQHQTANSLPGQFIQISPFGLTVMDPSKLYQRRGRLMTLLPRYAFDGNLLIGIEADSAQALSTGLSLYFSLAKDETLADTPGVPRIYWQYLCPTGWKRIAPQRVIEDNTLGLLRSGIVILALPDDMVCGGYSGDDLFWICASADRNLNQYGTLQAVIPHVLTASAEQTPLESLTPPTPPASPSTSPSPSTAGAKPPSVAMPKWEAVVSIPGIDKITGVSVPYGGCVAENRQQWLIRLSERLRHKQRAQTGKDYELLILQQFPWLDRVKCFANMRWQKAGSHPGHVLIIVLAKSAEHPIDLSTPPLVTGSKLTEIQDFISAVIPGFVCFDVRNPCFEKIQVNCALRFGEAYQGQKGSLLSRLDRDVSLFLYPFLRGGSYREFGWQLSLDSMFNLIDGLPYVEDVSALSLLRVYQQPHRDEDTQQQYFHRTNLCEPTSSGQPSQLIKPQCPWSLAIPTSAHIFHILKRADVTPDVNTGINRLEIGSTFIINKPQLKESNNG